MTHAMNKVLNPITRFFFSFVLHIFLWAILQSRLLCFVVMKMTVMPFRVGGMK